VNNAVPPKIKEMDATWDLGVPNGEIRFDGEVDAQISRAILEAVKPRLEIRPDASLKSLKPPVDPAGHYCLQSGKDRWFLRISRRPRKNLEIENNVTAFVGKNGFPVVVPLVRDLKVLWQGHAYLLYVFPFLQGRYFDGSFNDIRAVATGLRRLHEVLKQNPYAADIKEETKQTATKLERVKATLTRALAANDFTAFHELSSWAGRNKDFLSTMAGSFDPWLCRWSEAQSVHADLHLGNLLFSPSGEVVFVDFEETPDAWFPPAFDMAYLIHRLGFYGEWDERLLRQRLDALREGYGSWPPRQSEMLTQVPLYLIGLILHHCFERTFTTPERECDKFVKLFHLSNKVTL
jgi:Ser/Thr protein kinase RdoA (MazF antagonist)